MSNILIAILIGSVAGVIDIIPMIIQKLDKYSITSAFFQWVVLGLVISFIKIPGINGWAKGLITAVLMAIPIVILVAKSDVKSVSIILITSAVLGSLVGLASLKFIK
jgi:hypothetical protein